MRGDSVAGASVAVDLQQLEELRRLRRELTRFKMENEILKKAAVIRGISQNKIE